MVAGLTTTLTPNITNDFHYNYTYNWWQWSTGSAPPQLAGLGGALEIGGESANALIPYNVNTQSVRERFWDGQDHQLRDDMSYLHGNHLFQWGGLFQRNFNWHQRNDNGQGIMAAVVYQIGNTGKWTDSAGGVTYVPSGVPTGQVSNWDTLYTEILGIVGQPQTVYTRFGQNLAIQPLGTPTNAKSVVRYYNMYFSDTWHMKPSLTLSYGLGYGVEMPPVEQDGKQVMMVDAAGNPLNVDDYLAQRKSAALAGQVFNPVIGFAQVNHVGKGQKYPFHPFYAAWSPSVSAAWNPRFSGGILGAVFGEGNTVLRGGYRRSYGRINGVFDVLTPLLAAGPMQAVSCQGALNLASAVAGSQCPGVNANPFTGFRIGPTGLGFDGMTAPLPAPGSASGALIPTNLPQPYYPGSVDPVTGRFFAGAGDSSLADPFYRPNRSDAFTFSVQREVTPKIFMEAGYIGRKISNELQNIDMNAVPYMTTLGGQRFDKAFANVFTAICGLSTPTCPANLPNGALNTGPNAMAAVTPQPFFEAALGGPTSTFCKTPVTISGVSVTPTSCTGAVLLNATMFSAFKSNLVRTLWNSMGSQNGWSLGCSGGLCRTMASDPYATGAPGPLTALTASTSDGWSNYNAVYYSVSFRDFHGISGRSNLTWGRALGTGAVNQSTSSFTVLDPWDLHSMYGPQSFDLPLLYNVGLLYQPPWFKSQRGIIGRLLGGWSFSPLFTAQSGFPEQVHINTGTNRDCQSFGETNCGSDTTNENAVLIAPYTGGNSAHVGTTAFGTSAGTTCSATALCINQFQNPDAVVAGFRRLVLGVDHNGGGAGRIRGLPRWFFDASVLKSFRVTERVNVQFNAQFQNLLNHFQPENPVDFSSNNLNINNSSAFGVINSQSGNSRQIEFGLRLSF